MRAWQLLGSARLLADHALQDRGPQRLTPYQLDLLNGQKVRWIADS
jgi:hypothetical protein